MADIEVWMDAPEAPPRVGTMRRHPARGREAVSFEYDPSWIASPEGFALDPSLPLGRGAFRPSRDRPMFGAFGDSAPDSWGRALMRRRERRRAEREGTTPRTLLETDFLLGVVDEARLGALRFREAGRGAFAAPRAAGVPNFLALGRLLGAAGRISRDEETEEDLRLILAPGSSLGGAWPKASILDARGRLSIAKFPKDSDAEGYSLERWEAIALDMAAAAGLDAAEHDLPEAGGRPVLLSRRFDRGARGRIPFLSALSMTERRDREEGSYIELFDFLASNGADPAAGRLELFGRIAFSILVSNTDDHLRNHGFLRAGPRGWSLSPAYDINPVPADIAPRVLSTAIDDEDGTCSIDLLRSVAEAYPVKLSEADRIIRRIAAVTRNWRDFARKRGAGRREIDRMAGAFEHGDLDRATA